jgi:Ankyrin repeats (3 copies)
VVQMVTALERQAADQTRGLDRRGNTARGYSDSLPDFLKAAADGNLELLQSMIADQQSRCTGTAPTNNHQNHKTKTSVRELLDTCDRHKSIAEHWAAGGGHLHCLKYLLTLRDELAEDDGDCDNNNAEDDATPHHDNHHHKNNNKKRKIGRRDGKTSLHYACRNGRLDCVRYLVEERHRDVNEVSGDGTTPLHLACFGGHLPVVEYLLAHGALPHQTNDWQCSAAHWVAMSTCDDRSALWAVGHCLRHQHQVSFTARQGQGHTPLHKAAQKKNRHMIDWFLAAAADGGAGFTQTQWQELAQQRDDGGHLPSDLWRNAKGDDEILRKLEAHEC